MNKVKLLLAVVVLCSCAIAQDTQASMTVRSPKVEQGKPVSFLVKVSPTPNVSGAAIISVSPVGGSPSEWLSMSGSVGPERTEMQAEVQVPVNARLGKWKVERVIFRVPGSADTELRIEGNIQFEVVERKAVLPTTADVQVR
jgi:hypothetical protein